MPNPPFDSSLGRYVEDPETDQDDWTCRVVGCPRPTARGITVCERHGREWDNRHTADEFKAMSADEKHRDWLRFLAEAVRVA